MQPADATGVMDHAIRNTIEEGSAEVRQQAVRTAAILQVSQLDEPLAGIAASTENSLLLRLEALRGIVRRRPDVTEEQYGLLLSEMSPDKSPLSRLAAGQILAETRLNSDQFRRLIIVLRGDPLLSPITALGVFAIGGGRFGGRAACIPRRKRA